MSKRRKWNAECKDLFDVIREAGKHSVEVHAWSWVNDGTADVLWMAVGLLRWRVYEGPSYLPGAVLAEQGLQVFDLENENEADVICAAVHKLEELMERYECVGSHTTDDEIHEATP